MKYIHVCSSLFCIMLLLQLPLLLQTAESAEKYSWQDAHATVLKTGELVWKPKPFVFEKGASPRYIRFQEWRR